MIKIGKKGYLGVDESNHGKFPEIYVGVFSLNSILLEKKYNKKFHNSPNNKLVYNQVYSYLLIEKIYKNLYGEHGVKVISLAELIKVYNPELVLFDGELRDKDKANLEHILYPFKTKIIAERKADENYPLVHIADAIAYGLFKRFKTNKDLKRCKGHLIEPDMEKYLEYVSLFR